ncbi:hypothetical protein NDU88_001950 [Pleurodeles waltl]|uniref:Uncharacterized protein n=1 Tax=Pleurodeles waltl TaxID=8319 RepID=A0AAV7M102_PLEWA|nr:hypothetical protein NDU88_001950 [Pleurodeles waltl]
MPECTSTHKLLGDGNTALFSRSAEVESALGVASLPAPCRFRAQPLLGPSRRLSAPHPHRLSPAPTVKTCRTSSSGGQGRSLQTSAQRRPAPHAHLCGGRRVRLEKTRNALRHRSLVLGGIDAAPLAGAPSIRGLRCLRVPLYRPFLQSTSSVSPAPATVCRFRIGIHGRCPRDGS